MSGSLMVYFSHQCTVRSRVVTRQLCEKLSEKIPNGSKIKFYTYLSHHRSLPLSLRSNQGLYMQVLILISASLSPPRYPCMFIRLDFKCTVLALCIENVV